MTAAVSAWRADRWRLMQLAGVAVGLGAILLKLDFFLRPGAGEVLRGLAHHASILALLLILTAGSRTIRLGTLGIFWLLGVWTVYMLAYFVEEPLARQFGVELSDTFVPVWWAPVTEEALKVLPVAIYLLLAARSGRRHPSISDGILLGFMVGAGVAFQEDAHLGVSETSGEGWGHAGIWSAIFPTVWKYDGFFFLHHAIWTALAGFGVGLAVMLRQWRFWPVAVVFPILGVTNHITANYFVGNLFGLLGRADVPWVYDTMRDLSDSGRLPLLALAGGLVAVVVAEGWILRWVGKRDLMFPPLSIARASRLLRNCTSRAGLARLLAAERYVSLRRSVYYAGWRTRAAGGEPIVSYRDYTELNSLAARLGALPGAASPHPDAAVPADAAPARSGRAAPL